MTPAFVPARSLGPLLGAMLDGRRTFAVQAGEGGGRLARCRPEEFSPASCRSAGPLKPIFFEPRHDLGGYFGGGSGEERGPSAVLGARACDLAALKVLDWVFLQGDFADPGYGARRESTLIVSTDCTAPMDVCFCTYLGGRPHAEEGYDLNLSPVDGGYVVDAGSDAGQSMLGEHGAELSEATDDRLRQRAERRQAATDRVARGVEKFGVGPLDDMGGRVLDSGESALWEELAEKCVECGACNFVCPTCHCFLLLDLQNRHGFRRFQNWDACLYPAFAREASGVNPRARRGQRLRGRMEKKWDFIPADSGLWGCVGCGRCIQACAGGIDIRETLRDLAHA